MGLYAGLPNLTAQPTPSERAACRTASSASGRSTTSARSASTRRWRMRRSTPCARPAACRSSSAAAASTCAPRSSTSGCPRASAERARAPARSCTTSGARAAHARARGLDPAAAAAMHPNDRRRVVRALELAERREPAPGRGSAVERRAARARDDRSRSTGLPTSSRARIEQRTDAMLAGGALDEVRPMLRTGPALSCTARTIHGLRDCIAYLEGRTSLDECRDCDHPPDPALRAPSARLAP